MTGGGAIFRVVLDGAQNFTENFWKQPRQWTDIFTDADGSTVTSDWTARFASVEFYNITNGKLTEAPTTGNFTMSGNTLTWNYTAVPEPTTSLAALLLGAGLLRRRRA
jgi:hypothetical protein